MMIRAHVGLRLTQGSIFSCAQAEDYKDCNVHGLVITARCDIAHDKAEVFNYLPIVRMDDWLHRDFLSLIVARCEADIQQQFINFLKGHGVSERLLDTQSPHQIVSVFFSEEDLARKKERTKALEHLHRFDILKDAKKSEPHEYAVLRLATEFPKIKDRLIRECVHQQISGYYFLPRIEKEGIDSGFVVLMREVRYIPRDIALGIGKGLDNQSYVEICKTKTISYSVLDFEVDDFSSCVGNLESPALEHLMQTFSLLFGRIGLPDPDASYITRLWSIQPSVNAKKETNK